MNFGRSLARVGRLWLFSAPQSGSFFLRGTPCMPFRPDFFSVDFVLIPAVELSSGLFKSKPLCCVSGK